MSKSRGETRAAREIQEAFDLPYTMALRMLREKIVEVDREGTVTIVDQEQYDLIDTRKQVREECD